MGSTVYKEGVEPTHNARWTVSLSSGETFYEGKGKFEVIPGEQSPWNRLMDYIQDNNLQITSLGIYAKTGQRYNLPSSGIRPKMGLYKTKVPRSYKFWRCLGRELDGRSEDDVYAVLECVFDPNGSKVQMWVSDKDVRKVWLSWL